MILVIDPDPARATVLVDAIRARSTAEIVCARNATEALVAIDAQVPDLVLLDALLSSAEGERVTDYLRLLPEARHVQTVNMPIFASAHHKNADADEPREARRTSPMWFLSRKKQAPPALAGADPQAFAADVAEYLARTDAMRAHDSHHADGKGGRERREQIRRLPFEMALVSSIKLAASSAELINISSTGALVRTDVRPDPRIARGWAHDTRTRATLTLVTEDGEEIAHSGQAIRCHVKQLEDGRTVYEVAIRFEEELNLDEHVIISQSA